jgi:hypothetical protein
VVAGLYQQLGIRAHEGNRHRQLRPVRQQEFGAVPEVLDDAEEIVPSPCVEPGGVVAQLVKDLIHLEGGQDGLDQDGASDRSGGDAQLLLGEDEYLVPQSGFEVILQLRQVEVRPAAAIQ